MFSYLLSGTILEVINLRCMENICVFSCVSEGMGLENI